MASTAGDIKFSEPEYTKVDAKKKFDYPFYLPSIDKYLIPSTQKLLEDYGGIPREQQSKHVHDIRDQAFSIRAYPCTGLGVFLVPYISHSPVYTKILERLKAGNTLMDVGCFVGGDLRRLVFDGAPSENMYGVDIVNHWDIGYSLYRDRGRFKAQFIERDILSADAPDLMPLKGKIDIVSISAVLHQWSWQDQIEAAKKLVAFSKPGSIIVGHQIGNLQGQTVVLPSIKVPAWRHEPSSFEAMWNQVGVETGSSWETKAWLRTFEDMDFDPQDSAWMEAGVRVIDFVVTRTG